MTRYVHRVTAACPESMMYDGNHLAAAWGESIHDLGTYEHVTYQDSDGNRYAVTSAQATDVLLSRPAASVVRPAFDLNQEIDLAAAERCRAAIVFGGPAMPGQLTVYIDADPHAALAAMGLTRIEALE